MAGLVSIIMPSYNTGRFIAETVRSVMAQTYTDWELIIVDDCSTDNTLDVLQADFGASPERHSGAEGDGIHNSRIRLFCNDKNSGAAVSRNKALREARGKYIAFLDSDDLWAPDKLEKQIRFMEENGYAFTYTKYSEIDESGNSLGVTVGGPKHIGKTGMFNYCWPGCLTVMYDREVVGEIQIADIKKNNDYAIWLKVVCKAKCHLLDENLAKYRKRGGLISIRGIMSFIKWSFVLFKRNENFNTISAAMMVIRNSFFCFLKLIFFARKAV